MFITHTMMYRHGNSQPSEKHFPLFAYAQEKFFNENLTKNAPWNSMCSDWICIFPKWRTSFVCVDFFCALLVAQLKNVLHSVRCHRTEKKKRVVVFSVELVVHLLCTIDGTFNYKLEWESSGKSSGSSLVDEIIANYKDEYRKG